MNFGASGAIGHIAQQMIPIYRHVNTYKKAKALKKAGKTKLSAGASLATSIGANALSNVPGYSQKMDSEGNFEVKTSPTGIALSGIGSAIGLARAGIVGSRFQDLIDEKTDAYMRRHPSADRDSIRKKIKSRLYHEGEVDLGKIKND